MDLLILVGVLPFLFVYVAYKETIKIAYRRRLAEVYLFHQRLGAYEQLKSAVEPVRSSGTVSREDTSQFAQAKSAIRVLFNKEVEQFIDGIYGALVRKHTLDALLAKVVHRGLSSGDKALTELASKKSEDLYSQITNGIYRDMPKRMEKFMQVPHA